MKNLNDIEKLVNSEDDYMKIESITEKDIAKCLEIYNYYIKNSLATLEEDELSLEEFSRRINRITASYPFLVAKEGEEVLGYAYLDVFNSRSAYKITADLSIYVKSGATNKNVGGALFAAIEEIAKTRGIENIVSIITDENIPSIAFHERNGFIAAGELQNVARKFGKTVGVKYYVKSL